MIKRIHYLPKQKMQLALTLRLLLLTVLFAFFIGFEVYITVWPVVSEFIPETLMGAVREQILFRVVFFSIPLLFVIGAFYVIFTHRIAGPLHRLEQVLDRLIKGESVEKINLRRNDELGDLTTRINTLISMIQDKRGR